MQRVGMERIPVRSYRLTLVALAIAFLLTLSGLLPAAVSAQSEPLWNAALPSWFAQTLSTVESPASAGPADATTGTEAQASRRSVNAGEIVVTEDDDGCRVEMRDGQILVVDLPANPSTGYTWDVATATSGRIRRIGEPEFEPKASLLGAPGREILRFMMLEPGETVLSLVYRRPWNRTDAAPRSFSAQIKGVGSFDEGPKYLADLKNTVEWSAGSADRSAVTITESANSTASSFDWCSYGACTPVKNQGSCGSCWAFATNGVMESAIAIRDGVTRDLSEQYLVSCNAEGWGCNGGWWAFGYYLDEGEPDDGTVYEADFEYVAEDVACESPYPHHEVIASQGFASPSVDAIKSAIQTYGPVAVGVCVGPDFQAYDGGIFSTNEDVYCGSAITNHGVVLVGWDDGRGSNGAWHLKNSWSTWWGESGYMWIEYGISNVGYGAAFVDYQGQSPEPNSPPNAPSAPSPADGAMDQSVDADLSWTGGDPDGDSVTYDVYVDPDDLTPTTLVCDDTSSPSCVLSTLDHRTHYYWQVVATDSQGDFTSGPIWDFRTEAGPNSPPNAPSAPSPADGAVDQSVDADLNWSGGDPDGDSVTYDVYLDPDDMTPTTLVCSGVPSPECAPPTLDYDTKYFWKVVSTDSEGHSTVGPTWQFATAQPVAAAFAGDPLEGVAPLDVSFANQSAGTYDTCEWDFGEGSTFISCAGVTHTYGSPGTYTVTLAVSGAGGADVATRRDYVTVLGSVTAAFAGDPLEGPAPLQVSFVNESIGAYDTCEWTFGDGSTAVGCSELNHTYTSSGVYTVSLTTSGAGGTDTATRSSYVEVHQPVVAAFVGDPLEGAPPLQVAFTNQSTGAFDTCEWDFGDGSTGSGCGPTGHAYDESGAYTVTLTIEGPGGIDDQVRRNYITISHPLAPVSDLVLHQVPAGDLFVGNGVRFHVDAKGTIPFTYTWTVGGVAAASESNHFEYTCDTAGRVVFDVTVSNPAGKESTSTELIVQQPSPEGQPDLSASFKMVDPTTAVSGDLLTYTAILRNDSPVAAQGSFVDPIPTYTSYVAGSAQASDGGEVTYKDGNLHWSGRIIEGVPVVMQYQAEVQEIEGLEGAGLSAVGRLEDGRGNQTLLEVESVFGPAVAVSIDQGALYTNSPTVTLSFQNDEGLPYVQVCNDGRFSGGTGWTEFEDTQAWQLDLGEDPRAPLHVYAVFRNEEGEQAGPVHDAIIYDSTAPQITRVSIGQRALGAVARVAVIDDNSGVDAVQLSQDPSFAVFSEIAVMSNTVDVPLQDQAGAADEVFLRAVDRAGNYSSVCTVEHRHLYLPLVVRGMG